MKKKGRARLVCREPDNVITSTLKQGEQWLDIYAPLGEYLGTLKITRFEDGRTALTLQARVGVESRLDPNPVRVTETYPY